MQVISENLKKLREVLGLTHQLMGTLAGVTGRSWQDYEAGIKTPGGKVFEALAKVGVNTNWIFTSEGPMRLDSPAAGSSPPGSTGYLFGMAITKLANSPPFSAESLETLGNDAAVIVDLTPRGLDYVETVQSIDALISWLALVLYEKNESHDQAVRPTSPDLSAHCRVARKGQHGASPKAQPQMQF